MVSQSSLVDCVLGGQMKKIIIAIAASIALPGSVFAQALNPISASASNSDKASSWVAGAHVGYNWQGGAWVYGLEADISAINLNSEMNTVFLLPIPIPPPTANANAEVNWYGTLRGRLGWSSGPVLLYGTGGLAYGRVELNSSISAGPLFLSSQTSSVRTGWVVGAGIEYMWRPNAILNIGYQHVDLGTVSLASTTPGGNLSQSASTHARFDVVTVGLSWHFSPTDKAPPGTWEGMYAGGHVGGAWGNSASASYFAQPAIAISDVRLKRDIDLIARLDNGLGLYRYRYLWSDTVDVGVMAQEVALLYPDAIVRDALDDYLRVDYSRLGLKLMTHSDWAAHRRL